MIVSSVIALELGFTAPTITVQVPSEPTGGIIESLISIAAWVFNSAGSFVQLITFQVEGLPAAVSIIYLFFSIVLLYMVLRLVRGGG